MAVTVLQFRQAFVAFQNTTIYPDAMVQLWLNFAYSMLDPTGVRWQGQVDLGAQLFAAHNLVLEGLANAEAANGAPPGTTVGPISSKSVGGVTVSYDTGSGVELDAGHWNLTNYGTRFIHLARLFGQGPLQVGIGCAPPGSGPPWPGVINGPWGGGW